MSAAWHCRACGSALAWLPCPMCSETGSPVQDGEAEDDCPFCLGQGGWWVCVVCRAEDEETT